MSDTPQTFTFITLPSPTGGRGNRLWLDEDALSRGTVKGYEWGEQCTNCGADTNEALTLRKAGFGLRYADCTCGASYLIERSGDAPETP